MGGLRGLQDEPRRLSQTTGELPPHAIALALALHRATYAGDTGVSLNDLAARTGVPIEHVISTAVLLEKKNLVRITPWQAERLAPVDWLNSSREEQLKLMGRTVVTMTPFLPSLLEGQLDYSPAADEAVVGAVVREVDPADFPHPDELIARVSLPPRRAREALVRYMRGPLEAGMRLRVTMDITFPGMTHDNSLEIWDRLVELIANNTVIRCEEVRFRAATTDLTE